MATLYPRGDIIDSFTYTWVDLGFILSLMDQTGCINIEILIKENVSSESHKSAFSPYNVVSNTVIYFIYFVITLGKKCFGSTQIDPTCLTLNYKSYPFCPITQPVRPLQLPRLVGFQNQVVSKY